MKYSPLMLEHFYQPRHVGVFAADEKNIGTGRAGEFSSGDALQIQIKVTATREQIVEACFKAYGSAATIAVGSWLTEWLQGKTLAAAAELNSEMIMQALELPRVKLHCALLGEDAVKAALKVFQK